ncbi:MAG: glycosyltransferase family 2 protein [Chromatiales bacterium]|nr:glycosyltransferase family 2 protein [Chromatiales bacterium]
MEFVLWGSFLLVFYAYFGYPFLLMAVNRISRGIDYKSLDYPEDLSVTLIIPVHNEEAVIERKLDNTKALDFSGNLQVLIVSDGSSDNTAQIVKAYQGLDNLTFIELEQRKGKANALNAGLQAASGDIIVFSDASIMFDSQAITEIVRPFALPEMGCVSGEDLIEGGSGEGLYGKYELFLRKQESVTGSIVGASGSLYAQRKEIVTPFIEGVAPDFYSVLNTVEQGYRAISISESFGYMKAAESHKDEFNRKVRTLIRGITALFKKARLLNPISYPRFSLYLISHKLIRWLVPFFLISLLVSNLFLLDSPFYLVLLLLQLLFYGVAALAAFSEPLQKALPLVKLPLFFVSVNVSILKAWLKYLSGTRQEIWTPTKRSE